MKKSKSKTKYIIFIIAVFAAGSFFAPKLYDSAEIFAVNNIAPAVQIGQSTIFVEVAATSEQTQKGLSGRNSLPPHRGMLFIFSQPAIHRFWMPDMRFPLDIIWINNGKVIDISENVSNEFDPKNPRFYTPSAPAQYVLEVNAGFALRRGIKIGDQVTLSHID